MTTTQGQAPIDTNTASGAAGDLADTVSKALRRAWQLGQTYWQQADSESFAQNKKPETTHAAFLALLDDTRATLASAPAPAPAQAAPAYKDSTPELHIGDSAFESWYSTYSPAHKSDKQRARDAYAAGMGDPLVVAAPTPQPAAQDAELYQFIRNCNMEDRNKLEHYSKDALDKAIRAACSSTRREGMTRNIKTDYSRRAALAAAPAQHISKDERALRRLLCAKYEHLPYMDDGEAHGQTLDWLRGSVEEIETRIREINIESFAAQPDAHMQMASPIFALAVQALNGVKAWRDCEGNDGFPDEVREQIDAVLSAFELRYTTHPTTGEPIGTDAQEATAWRLTVENLEREIAVLRDALLQGARAVEGLKRECGMDPESSQAIRNSEYMGISYAMRAALAGTAPARSKEYAELPEDGYLFATGCGGCVKVWSATQMQTFADATCALRTASRGQAPAGAALGLPIAQEPKYTVTGAHIVNRATGEAVPHDEPVFVFRARDALGVRALEAYLALIGEREPSSEHAEAVRGRIADFQRFAASNPARMKWPDTTPQADSQPAQVRPLLPESLTRAVDRWFAENTGSGGCSDKDVRELAALFYGVTYIGGRESVDDALAIVESFGPGIGGLNDTYARQILLAEEVKRLCAARAQADSVLEDAARDVLAERQRQISAEGWTPEHDDEHHLGELSQAAACYASQAFGQYSISAFWPWAAKWWKPSQDPRRNLEKAGALILAEMERIDRAARKQGVTDCAGGSPCSTCPDKKKCAYGCVRQGGKA